MLMSGSMPRGEVIGKQKGKYKRLEKHQYGPKRRPAVRRGMQSVQFSCCCIWQSCGAYLMNSPINLNWNDKISVVHRLLTEEINLGLNKA